MSSSSTQAVSNGSNNAYLLHSMQRQLGMDTQGLEESLEQHHVLLKGAAERFAVVTDHNNNASSDEQGSLERVLQGLLGGGRHEDVAFFDKARERVLALAEANATKALQMKRVTGLVQALGSDDLGDGGSDDFETQMVELWNQAISEEDASSQQEEAAGTSSSKYVAEVRSKLNLDAAAARKKNGGDDDDSDEELTIVNNAASSGDPWICPMTRTAMVDPVTSQTCGHSFSKEAILVHLRSKRTCPVPGCLNRSMTPSELKENLELAQHVRRQNRRANALREQQSMTQALVDVDEDDDDDESAGPPPAPTRGRRRVKSER